MSKKKTMSKKILKFISNYGNVSFAELNKNISGFKGNYEFGNLDKNIVWWPCISQEAIKAINNLLKAQKIKATPTGVLIYIMDGGMPKGMEIAKQNRKYKSKRWLPLKLDLV